MKINKLQAKLDKLNRDFPVGSSVQVKLDDGTKIETKVRWKFSIIAMMPVGWFEDIRGAYDAARVSKPKPQAESL